MLFAFKSDELVRVLASVRTNRAEYGASSHPYWAMRVGVVIEIDDIRWDRDHERAIIKGDFYSISTKDIVKLPST